MRFTFDLTKQDYLDFNLFTVQNYKIYKKQKKIFRLIFTAIPFLVFVADWLLGGRSRSVYANTVSFFLMAVLSVLLWIYFPKLYDKITQANAKKILFKEGRLNILGERELSFEERHIRHITQYEESTTKYEIITDIKESNTAIYLYTSPAMAIIIPLRVFKDENEKRDFISFINAKVK